MPSPLYLLLLLLWLLLFWVFNFAFDFVFEGKLRATDLPGRDDRGVQVSVYYTFLEEKGDTVNPAVSTIIWIIHGHKIGVSCKRSCSSLFSHQPLQTYKLF